MHRPQANRHAEEAGQTAAGHGSQLWGVAMDLVIHALDLIGTAVFATTGALAAGGKRMDAFGVVVLGCVTALGGGTLRDIILGSQPVFWIADTDYLAVAASVGLGTFLVAQRYRLPAMALAYADAVGLAVFTVIGYQIGFESTQTRSIAMVMGVTTGVVGGIVRDVLAGEIPLIFRQEIYASASLGGAALLALSSILRVPGPLAVSAAILTTLAIRLAALRWNLALPVLRLKDGGKPEAAGAQKADGHRR
jgi:uncharacterized membrane protein YeiH